MDPNWATVWIAVASSLVTAILMGVANYVALRVWMTRREEREATTKEKLTDHEDRIRDLERDVRPLDFAR